MLCRVLLRLLLSLVPGLLALGSGASTATAQAGASMPIRLENAAIRLVFDAQDGCLVELLDRATGHSFVSGWGWAGGSTPKRPG